jgi:hypothetical protein
MWHWGELVLTFVGNGSNRRRESDVEDDSGFGAISRNLILTCVRHSDIGNSLDTPRRLRPTIMYLLSFYSAPRRHVRLSSITPHNRTYDDLKIQLSNLHQSNFPLGMQTLPQRIKQLAEQCSLGPQPLSSSRTRIPGTMLHNIRKSTRHIRKPGMINEAMGLLMKTRLRTLR